MAALVTSLPMPLVSKIILTTGLLHVCMTCSLLTSFYHVKMHSFLQAPAYTSGIPM